MQSYALLGLPEIQPDNAVLLIRNAHHGLACVIKDIFSSIAVP